MLVTAGLLSYELLAVALVAVALLAWSRGRPLVAGLLLGAARVRGAGRGDPRRARARARPARRPARPALTFAVAAGAVWVGVRLLAYPNLDGGLPDAWEGWRDAVAGVRLAVAGAVAARAEAGRPHVPFWPAVHALSASAATTGALLGLVAVVVATLVLALAPGAAPGWPTSRCSPRPAA